MINVKEGALIQVVCQFNLKTIGHKANQYKNEWMYSHQSTYQSVLLDSGEVGLCLCDSDKDSYFVIALFRNHPYAVRKKNIKVLKNGKTKGISTFISKTI